jgi:hypothetical protein
MTVLKFAVLLFIPMLTTALHAAKMDKPISLELLQYYNDLLKHYKLIYTEEIFDYCIEKYGTIGSNLAIGSRLGSCMKKQDKLRNRILNYAQDQLGRRSLAQGIYDDCIDYYPMNGVARISKCVKTRLALDSKLKDDTIEKIIYQNCDFRWRKHGSGAIHNCSTSEANYYHDKGQLRDR